VALLCWGCGPREPSLLSPGTSNVSAVSSQQVSPPRDASARWEGFSQASSFLAIGKPFISRGHFAGRWKVQVSANEAASQAYATLSPSTRFSPGAVLVKTHSERESGAAGPLFVMLKRDAGFFPPGGDWEYLVTDQEGWIEDKGSLVTCARCHAEANADWVFGLPAEARP
jgi:hypothetical protein